MPSETLAREVGSFLADTRSGTILEDGVELFDLAETRFSITTEHDKCLLHLWSAERNIVRRVIDAEAKNGDLRLTVTRFGQSKPQKLEILRDRDRRTPTARKAARGKYQRLL